MTFTVRRSTAVILIALVGALGGMAVGQVTDALSSSPTATASASSENTLREIAQELKFVREGLVGFRPRYKSIQGLLYKIESEVSR